VRHQRKYIKKGRAKGEKSWGICFKCFAKTKFFFVIVCCLCLPFGANKQMAKTKRKKRWANRAKKARIPQID